MKTKYILSTLILSFGLAVSLFIVSDAVKAQTPAAPAGNAGAPSIQYPVPELGNCGNETECKTYCDDSAHLNACLTFAEKHNLMSVQEIQVAKGFAKAGGQGPGGCTTKESCNKYCDDIAHIDECIAFGEKNGLMSGADLTEAKKVQAAITKGVKPPACGGKQACDKYCSDSAHMEECITFGQAAGLMSEKELQDSQKVLQAIKSGVKPPACRGKEECDKYCQNPDHMEECITFSQAAGFMSAQEAQDSTKMLQAIKKGVKPPACRGKDECDKYCGDSAHTEECVAFAEAAGFMKPEEAAMARKTGGKGPGGCTSKESCDAFCNNPDNQETCFNFGRDNGMIPPEQLQQMEQGKKQFSEMLDQAPAEVISCISGVVGSGNLDKFKSGSVMPPRDVGDKIGKCFQQMGPQGPGAGGNIPPGQNGQGQQGQGGQFQPGPGVMNPGGQMMPQQAGPGGCKTPEECQSFCQSNPDVCKNFETNGPRQGPGQRQGGPMQPQMRIQGDQQPGQGGPGSDFQGMMEKVDVMQGNFPGVPAVGQTCQPGTQCGPGPGGPTGPNQPGANTSIPGVQQMRQFMQPMQPGTPQGTGGTMPPQGTPPAGGMMQPGASGPPTGGATQQFQQPQQQFQPTPPPSGGTNPPPAGGSLLNIVKSLFGF